MFRLEELRKVYPNGFEALRGLDLELRSGELLAIIGPSGAGKSTLIRVLTRLIEPTSGRVFFDGRDITRIGARDLRLVQRQVGMIFQQFHLVKRLSVFQNTLAGRLGYVNPLLASLGLFSRAERRRAIEALESVGMLSFALHRADALSGGQQQRVAIARALVQEPRVLLADEPIASLDPANSELVISMLADINRRRGTTVVVNLHQVEYARRYAGRIVALAHGKVVFDGPPELLTAEAVEGIYGTAGADPARSAAGTELQERPPLAIQPTPS